MTGGAYYNDNDPKAAAWLRELIKHGHIAPGDVDDRSIEVVKPGELTGYAQHHFFAGIGGWSYALRLAGWPDDRPAWTGSCPCQPFSVANSRRKVSDPRNLWPAFYRLVRELTPTVVFGEQVASPLGLAWLDTVCADLESSEYAVAAADLCAAGVGAPHIRQRLYWVALAGSERLQGERLHLRELGRGRGRGPPVPEAGRRGEASPYSGLIAENSGLGNAGSAGGGRDARAIPSAQRGAEGGVRREFDEPQPSGSDRSAADADSAGPQGRGVGRDGTDQCSPWAHSLVGCRDGKWRPIEPGSFPLAHGVPGRVGLLRGYGNAIVPQVAAAFIEASGVI